MPRQRRRFIVKAGGRWRPGGPAVVHKKLAAELVREESEKSPMARRVYASFTKVQAQLAGWSRISEGAYHQFVAL